MERLLIVGKFSEGTLDSSYRAAFQKLGYEVYCSDVDELTRGYARLGKFGRKFNDFVPVEAWFTKANRDIVIKVLDLGIKTVIVFGNWRMHAGALAQIKAGTQARLINIWPDTLLNLKDYTIISLPLYDLVATYSQTSVPLFAQLGARKALWVPLAGDPDLHPHAEVSGDGAIAYKSDVTFIGGWRPERETALTRLIESNALEVKIWGPEWGQRCQRNKAIMHAWQGRALRGAEFAKAVRCAKINLNVIDQTNYPAANMRFFEIPIAGGVQLSSSCPEMEAEFRHGEQIFYYHEVDELIDLATSLVNDPANLKLVAEKAQAQVLQSHTYQVRASFLLRALDADD